MHLRYLRNGKCGKANHDGKGFWRNYTWEQQQILSVQSKQESILQNRILEKEYDLFYM